MKVTQNFQILPYETLMQKKTVEVNKYVWTEKIKFTTKWMWHQDNLKESCAMYMLPLNQKRLFIVKLKKKRKIKWKRKTLFLGTRSEDSL